jgi:hypothetical protein
MGLSSIADVVDSSTDITPSINARGRQARYRKTSSSVKLGVAMIDFEVQAGTNNYTALGAAWSTIDRSRRLLWMWKNVVVTRQISRLTLIGSTLAQIRFPSRMAGKSNRIYTG